MLQPLFPEHLLQWYNCCDAFGYALHLLNFEAHLKWHFSLHAFLYLTLTPTWNSFWLQLLNATVISIHFILPCLYLPVLFCSLPSVLRKKGCKWPVSGPNNNLIEWRFIKTVLMATVVSRMEKQPRGLRFSTSFLTSIYKAQLSSGNLRTEWNNETTGF